MFRKPHFRQQDSAKSLKTARIPFAPPLVEASVTLVEIKAINTSGRSSVRDLENPESPTLPQQSTFSKENLGLGEIFPR